MINISIMGGFRINHNGKTIGDDDNRSKKLWLLLEYMILNRGKRISKDGIINLLWTEESKVTNTSSAVKTTIHRLRSQLDALEENFGSKAVTYSSTGYGWNEDIAYEMDIERFERDCKSGNIESLLSALDSYSEILPGLLDEQWIQPIRQKYHNMYLTGVTEACSILGKSGDYETISSVCTKAIKLDPLNDPLYCNLLEALLALGKARQAARLYEQMSDLFIGHYGLSPSERASALYRRCFQSPDITTMPVDTIIQSLEGNASENKALFLEYDFFKSVYQIYARLLDRTMEDIFIGVLTINEPDGRKLQERSIQTAVDNMMQLLLNELRSGDIITKCSRTQFIFILPDASYEDSITVCERLIVSFHRKHPHTPVQLQYSVLAIEPI